MTLRLLSTIFAVVALSACGREEPPAPEAAPPESSAETKTAPDTRPIGFGPRRPPASADSIGVPECDAFLTKYESCVSSKVPEESRGAMQTALEAWRGSWRTLSASPTTRGDLAQACRAAEESVRAQLTSYGCE